MKEIREFVAISGQFSKMKDERDLMNVKGWKMKEIREFVAINGQLSAIRFSFIFVM